jgi:hypothetical protein
MARILNIIFSASFVLFSSCRNNMHITTAKDEQKVEYKSCSLLIYSPYNCFYRIEFNKKGVGNLKAVNNYGKSENHKNDSLISNYSFIIDSKNDMSKINKLIEQIKASDSLHSPLMFDAYHFQFIVDEKKYIDVYGENKQVSDVLKILLNYISKNDGDKCGILKLFKQTLQ